MASRLIDYKQLLILTKRASYQQSKLRKFKKKQESKMTKNRTSGRSRSKCNVYVAPLSDCIDLQQQNCNASRQYCKYTHPKERSDVHQCVRPINNPYAPPDPPLHVIDLTNSHMNVSLLRNTFPDTGAT